MKASINANHNLLNTGNKFQLINNSGFDLCTLSSDLLMLRCANQTLGTLYSFLSNQAALRHLVNSRSMCLLHSNFRRHNFRSSKFLFPSLPTLSLDRGLLKTYIITCYQIINHLLSIITIIANSISTCCLDYIFRVCNLL